MLITDENLIIDSEATFIEQAKTYSALLKKDFGAIAARFANDADVKKLGESIEGFSQLFMEDKLIEYEKYDYELQGFLEM